MQRRIDNVPAMNVYHPVYGYGVVQYKWTNGTTTVLFNDSNYQNVMNEMLYTVTKKDGTEKYSRYGG